MFIRTALMADELLPLASALPLADGFRRIAYHRRGYAGSSPVDGPGSIRRAAAACQALLAALRIERAHAVGLSYSGAVALQLPADVPGASKQVASDRLTVFDTDLPALFTWQFDDHDAEQITCPVLHVGGSDTHRWFLEVRDLVRPWLPHAEDIQIEGAGHLLAITHTPHVAGAMADFLHRVSRGEPPP